MIYKEARRLASENSYEMLVHVLPRALDNALAGPRMSLNTLGKGVIEMVLCSTNN